LGKLFRGRKQDPMHEVPFHTDTFFSMLFSLALVPSLIILGLVMVLSLFSHKIRSKQPFPVTGALLALLAGFLPSALWLPWNSTTSTTHYFHQGAPTQFPKWQVYGCGISVVRSEEHTSELQSRFDL